MKILMLTPYLPYPLLTGGQTRSYNLIKRLSALGHEITLFCLVKGHSERKYVGELEKFCQEVRVFNRSEKPWTLSNILRTGFSFYPFLVIRNWAKGEEDAIDKKLKTERFDLIHAETFYVMPHIPPTEVPILLVEQTIEYLVYRHFADEFKFPGVKQLLYLDVMKMKHWELKYWQRATRVVAMSEEDKKSMLFQIPTLNVDIVPNGVDSDYFAYNASCYKKRRDVIASDYKIKDRSKTPIILYLGNFTWLQNREAVAVLVSKVWPKIKEKIPECKLWIIGKDAEEFFLKLESKDIRVSEVSDVREVYQQASVLVAPIYGGGGTRYKYLEAFASGLPVVTTSIGIRGTKAKDGVEVIIRDNPSDIADAVIEIINDKKLYSKIVKNARNMVKKEYDWDPIARKLSQIYEQLGRQVA